MTQLVDRNYLSLQTKKLIDIKNVNGLQRDDRRLLNFLLMRDIYPTHIRRADESFEIMEKFVIDRDAGLIRVSLPIMRPKESLMFIYYANISNHESQKTTAIVSIPKEIYPNQPFPFEFVFSSPEFEVRGDYLRQDIQPEEPISINYIVTLLNPKDTSSSYLFDAYIKNNDPRIKILPTSKLDLKFPPGVYESEITRNMTINESGTYNLPSLSINNNETSFRLNGFINVEPLWHKYILEITLAFLAFFTLIGGNLETFLKKENLKYRICLWIFLLVIVGCICYICKLWEPPLVLLSLLISFILILISCYHKHINRVLKKLLKKSKLLITYK
jgi:hypothetical protein